MKRNRKVGLVFTVVGALLLAVGGMGLLFYFAAESNTGESFTAVLVAAIIAFVLAAGCFVVMARTITFPEWDKIKADKAKDARYAALPFIPISDFKRELDEVRANFAADANPLKNRIIYGRFPNGDPLFDYSVIKSGKIYWAYLVQANEFLFRVNKRQNILAPAVCVWSPDPYFDANPLALAPIANSLFANSDHNFLRDEFDYKGNIRLSEVMTDGREVYCTTFFVEQSHLPCKALHGRLFPLIADASRKATFIVQDIYWTDKLIAGFVQGGAYE